MDARLKIRNTVNIQQYFYISTFVLCVGKLFWKHGISLCYINLIIFSQICLTSGKIKLENFISSNKVKCPLNTQCLNWITPLELDGRTFKESDHRKHKFQFSNIAAWGELIYSATNKALNGKQATKCFKMYWLLFLFFYQSPFLYFTLTLNFFVLFLMKISDPSAELFEKWNGAGIISGHCKYFYNHTFINLNRVKSLSDIDSSFFISINYYNI